MKELNSNKEWKKWGETDPLFGVASWKNKNKEGLNPWTDEEFYRLGASDWADFRGRWENYGLANESCLEIGCGAGRITVALGAYFKEVHALDISEKMMDYARQHILNPSVTFHLSHGTDIPLAGDSVSAVFSTYVFQHLDSLSVARDYYREIARVLKPNGTLMINQPIYQWPAMATGFRQIYAVRQTISDFEVMVKRGLMDRGLIKPIMRGLCYPIEFFYTELPKLGLGDIEVAIFSTKSNTRHPFVFAKKLTRF